MPRDQPNSSCSGSISRPGRERNAAAPTRVTKVTAATTHARCGPVRAGGRAAAESVVTEESGTGPSCRSAAQRRDEWPDSTICVRIGPWTIRCTGSWYSLLGAADRVRRGDPAAVFGRAEDARRRTVVRGREACSTAGPSTDVDSATGSPRTATPAPGDRRHRRGPGTSPRPAVRRHASPDELAAALARIRPGTRLVSICTGAFVARRRRAARRPAGHHALDLRRALPAPLPEVELDAGVLFTDDGDVLTSAGVARRDRPVPAPGPARPRHRSRQRGRPAPSYRPPRRRSGPVHRAPGARAARQSTAAARAWALERLEEPIQVPELARAAGMSVRTFTRRFRTRPGSRRPPVADPAAGAARAAAPGVHGPARRRGRRPRGAGVRGVAPGAPAHPGGRLADGVPPHLPGGRTRLKVELRRSSRRRRPPATPTTRRTRSG